MTYHYLLLSKFVEINKQLPVYVLALSSLLWDACSHHCHQTDTDDKRLLRSKLTQNPDKEGKRCHLLIQKDDLLYDRSCSMLCFLQHFQTLENIGADSWTETYLCELSRGRHKDCLHHSFQNPLYSLSSAHLSFAHFGMRFCLEGPSMWQHEALYCLSRLGLIRQNGPGGLGKRCIKENQSSTNAITVAWGLWNRWMTGALCCNSVG